ncbi:MAG TPA: hypothetical protein VGA21_14570 [Cyclobacteriaceae bacterium]|jgi:hypothetical protein
MDALNDLAAGMGILTAGVAAAVVLTYVVNTIGRRFNNGENLIDMDLF